MSQNITWLGTSYSDVPAITLPKTGGGTARFTDVTDTTATASDVAQGKYFYLASGEKVAGMASGGSTGLQIDSADTVTDSASSSITFTGLQAEPTSFTIYPESDKSTGSPANVVAVVFDGTTIHGQTASTTSNANAHYDTDFTKSYSNGTLTVTATSASFPSDYWLLDYTYGGSVETANVQVGSGATSITFTGLDDEPEYFTVIFKSDFGTSSGYQRVIWLRRNDVNIYGACMDSKANLTSFHWTSSYSNGSLTITSQGTNAGGYFHQPGYYQLTYALAGGGGGGNSYTRTVVVPQQTVTPDSSRKFDFTYSSAFVDGEYYIVTLDGVEWLTTSETIWENEVVIGDSSVPWNASDDIYPFVMSSGTGYFTDTNQHILKVEHLEFVDGPSSGSATYRLDNIVPEQMVACTTFVQNNSYYGFLTFSSAIEDSEQYLVTFDGTEYVCEGYVPETNATGVGDLRVTQTTGAQYLITQFYIGYQTGNMALFVRGSGTHTVKVDKLTFIDDGETFTTKTITANGTYNASSDNVDGYSSVTVNVPSSGGTYQAKTNITPTTSSQTITPDSGYDALSSVQVNAMPSGTAGTPSATKGTVSNHSITVTPSVTNTTGYITGSTKTGTAVTVSASELVSGSETKTANGTYDVTNLASLVVNIPIVTYHTSSSAPTSSQGSNGDLWLVTA